MAAELELSSREDVVQYMRQRELDDLRMVAKTEQGRRMLWKIMAEAGIFKNPFTGNSQTFYNCGLMKIGQTVLRDLMELDPDLFAQMQRENQMLVITDDRMMRAAEKKEMGVL